MQTQDERTQKTLAVTWLGASVNIALALGKVIAGLVGNSKALVLDGLHSLADLLSDAIVLVAARLAQRPPDAKFPYGYEKIETFATVALATLLIAGGAILFWDSVVVLWEVTQGRTLEAPAWWVFLFALVSVGLKEWLFQRTHHLAHRLHSELLHANAWHHRSDAFSSLLVIIGTLGALLGVLWLDLVAALGIAVLIMWMGIQQFIKNTTVLLDASIPEDTQHAILKTAENIPGILRLWRLRSRQLGSKYFIDAYILVAPHLSTSESHYLADMLEHALRKQGIVEDVVIHVTTEFPHTIQSTLPLRHTVLEILAERCQSLPHYAALEDVRLHYLHGKIELELVWAWSTVQPHSPISWTLHYQRALGDLPWLKHVRFYFVLHQNKSIVHKNGA